MVYLVVILLLVLAVLVFSLVRLHSRQSGRSGQPEADKSREMAMTQSQLMRIAHHAGIAELNQGILKNIYNILSSVNVSTSVAADLAKKIDARSLSRLAELLQEHQDDLQGFFKSDAKGQKVPKALCQLAEYLTSVRESLVAEMSLLSDAVQKLNQIVKAQQAYAGTEAAVEEFDVNDLVADALLMESRTMEERDCTVQEELDHRLPRLKTHKIKLLQVVVTLLRNGAETIQTNCPPGERRLLVRSQGKEGHLILEVGDARALEAGEVIDPLLANTDSTTLTRRYFSLYYCASAVAEMHGGIRIFSEGLGHGALVRIDLPQR
jgi:signal transduction histidine kinase